MKIKELIINKPNKVKKLIIKEILIFFINEKFIDLIKKLKFLKFIFSWFITIIEKEIRM